MIVPRLVVIGHFAPITAVAVSTELGVCASATGSGELHVHLLSDGRLLRAVTLRAADAPDALCSQHVAALERGMFAVAMRAASELKSLSERRAATAEQAVALLAALGAAERLLASALEAIASEALLPEARRAALRAASPGVAVAKVATRRQRSLTKLRGVLHAAERAKGARTRQQRATEAELAARTMAAPDAAEALALAHRLRQG